MKGKLHDGPADQAGMLPERVQYVRELCGRWVEQGHTPTLGVCVARRGVIVLNEAFGVLGPGPESEPLSRNALFAGMSITKAITATLLMQLVEDGLVGLNRPAKDYIPDLLPNDDGELLIHHLLTHTSGFPFHTDPIAVSHVEGKLAAGFEPSAYPEGRHPLVHLWISLFCDVPLVAEIGEVMVYSNHNYELLGEIVRMISGKSLETLARERLLSPLGMHDTYYEVPESESARVVQRTAGLPMADYENSMMEGAGSRQFQTTPYAGAGIFTTPHDMTVFAQMILNGGRYGDARILSPASVATATCDQIPGVGANFINKIKDRASWGYGWAVSSATKWKYFDGSLQPLGTVSHPGAGGQTFWIDKEHELVGAYFEVVTHMTEDWEFLWNFDLFQNAITSAVED